MRSSRRFLVLLFACALLVCAGGQARGEMIGSPLVAGQTRDYNWGGLFVYNDPFTTPGNHVVEWGFYSSGIRNDVGTNGVNNLITPILFQRTAALDFTIIGIGTTRTNAGTGEQHFAFDLVAGTGTDIVQGTNTYFGWRDGSILGDVTNDGTVELKYTGGPGLFYFPTNAPATLFGPISDGYSFTAALAAGRTYSVEATAVPEPATLLLVGAGLAGIVRAGKRLR